MLVNCDNVFLIEPRLLCFSVSCVAVMSSVNLGSIKEKRLPLDYSQLKLLLQGYSQHVLTTSRNIFDVIFHVFTDTTNSVFWSKLRIHILMQIYIHFFHKNIEKHFMCVGCYRHQSKQAVIMCVGRDTLSCKCISKHNHTCHWDLYKASVTQCKVALLGIRLFTFSFSQFFATVIVMVVVFIPRLNSKLKMSQLQFFDITHCNLKYKRSKIEWIHYFTELPQCQAHLFFELKLSSSKSLTNMSQLYTLQVFIHVKNQNCCHYYADTKAAVMAQSSLLSTPSLTISVRP